MKKIAHIFSQAVLISSFLFISAACQTSLSNQNGNTSQTDQIYKSPLPPPTGFVNDYSNILDGDTKKRLESTLAQLKERSLIEFAVVLVDTTEGQSINDYSTAVARGWGLGPIDKTEGKMKGGGLLLLVAVKDRQWRIEVSKTLEKELPNDVALELGRLMNEPFRQQKYDEGVTKCVDAIIRRLAEQREFVIDKPKEIEVKTKPRQ